MAFLTGISWHLNKSWYTVEGPNKDFGIVSQIDLTRSLVPFIAKATDPFLHDNNNLYVKYISQIFSNI